MSSPDTASSGTGFSKPPSPRVNPKIGLTSPNRWAGGAYNNSPHPDSLPLPVFLNDTPSNNCPRETVEDFCIDTKGVQLPSSQLNNNISSPGSSPRNSMNGAAIPQENLDSTAEKPSPHKKRTVSSPQGAPVYQPTAQSVGTVSPNRRSPPRKQRQKKGKTRSFDGAIDEIPLPNQNPAPSQAHRAPSHAQPSVPVQPISPVPSAPVQSSPIQHLSRATVLPSENVMPIHSSPVPIPRLPVLPYGHYLPATASMMMSPPSPPLYSSYPVRGVDLNQLSNDLRKLLNIVPSDPIAV